MSIDSNTDRALSGALSIIVSAKDIDSAAFLFRQEGRASRTVSAIMGKPNDLIEVQR